MLNYFNEIYLNDTIKKSFLNNFVHCYLLEFIQFMTGAKVPQSQIKNCKNSGKIT